MTTYSETPSRPLEDPVSNVLKWILLLVAIGSFGLFAWATVLTYERAPPQPDRFVTAGGAALMTDDDIVAGKGGFQSADLMDYGSLYGMGSYFGEDYTAFELMRLATLTEDNLAQSRLRQGIRRPAARAAGAVRTDDAASSFRGSTSPARGRRPRALAAAIARCGPRWQPICGIIDLAKGWTPASSLDQTEAPHTADFLIYSALTTVARRPDTTFLDRRTGRIEPEVGNTPSTNTFLWTWVSICFTFLPSAWCCSSTSFG